MLRSPAGGPGSPRPGPARPQPGPPRSPRQLRPPPLAAVQSQPRRPSSRSHGCLTTPAGGLELARARGPREPPHLCPDSRALQRCPESRGGGGEAWPALTSRPAAPPAVAPSPGSRPSPAPFGGMAGAGQRGARGITRLAAPRPPGPSAALPEVRRGGRQLRTELRLKRRGPSATFARHEGRRSCGRSPAARSR